jgi:hypothetical protein
MKYKVADMTLAEFGRKELDMAESMYIIRMTAIARSSLPSPAPPSLPCAPPLPWLFYVYVYGN